MRYGLVAVAAYVDPRPVKVGGCAPVIIDASCECVCMCACACACACVRACACEVVVVAGR